MKMIWKHKKYINLKKNLNFIKNIFGSQYKTRCKTQAGCNGDGLHEWNVDGEQT